MRALAYYICTFTRQTITEQNRTVLTLKLSQFLVTLYTLKLSQFLVTLYTHKTITVSRDIVYT